MVQYSLSQLKKLFNLSYYDKNLFESDCAYLDIPFTKVKTKYELEEKDFNALLTLHKKYNVKELKDLKRVKTCEQRYGQAYANNVAKAKATLKEKYGDENYRNPEKARQTCLQRYGVVSANMLESKKAKIKQTVLEKYGTENVMQAKAVREKAERTCIQKYGATTPLLNEEVQSKIRQNTEQKWLNEQSDLEKVYGKLVRFTDAANLIDRDVTTLYCFVRQENIELIKTAHIDYLKESDVDYIKQQFEIRVISGVSIEEKQVLDFVKSVYGGEILENQKGIIGLKELDIYIPEKKLAIEFDGLYWHSDATANAIPSEEFRKIVKYKQLEKTKLCEQKGIRLIHVFEDDWLLRKNIVCDILKQALGICDRKIMARKCEVKDLENNTYKEFLERNHLQGYSQADIRLGLFYEGELVECIGISSKGTHSKESELVRLCSVLGTNVLGGFSKLLKHSGFNYLTSYIDRATFSGNGYNKTGFQVLKENEPVYFYLKFGKGITVREPRYKYMRKYIQQKFENGELSYFDEKETEEENMYKNGYNRIWNCGTIKVAINLA